MRRDRGDDRDHGVGGNGEQRRQEIAGLHLGAAGHLAVDLGDERDLELLIEEVQHAGHDLGGHAEQRVEHGAGGGEADLDDSLGHLEHRGQEEPRQPIGLLGDLLEVETRLLEGVAAADGLGELLQHLDDALAARNGLPRQRPRRYAGAGSEPVQD